ncbi:MAG: filamentous hemagglutinin N-terminal domain-containing protein [Rhodocyclales bacterium]|nr:filamentous hemagglutinin N-terminal domain-containing protein [Rhodocyclales bacterium]
MAACFAVSPVFSNPVNPVVVSGTASVNQSGNVLTVTNSNGAIINWDKFSIKAGETTHFAQTSASSAVLNRVLNDPSAIYGTLSSNGRVWLINPAGILVGAGGRIDTAGFVASTLKLRNEDFLAGRKLFEDTPGAGNVINQGEIRTPSGGSVYLVGRNVSNEGIIHTPAGETILASGATVSLIDSATPGVKVDITGAEGNSTNLGTISAEAGRVGIAGVIVRNSGLINASSVVSDGGRVFLKASRDAYVDGSGRIVTTGTTGGSVEVLGNRVAVTDSAEIDASGKNGGGRILVGGDFQGRNAEVRNAAISYFGQNASLKADATEVGAGGTVIVWADDTTRAYGSISARGGAISGDGGFVETSGKRFLDVNGIVKVDTRAPNGSGGNWLLDPSDITISTTPPDVNVLNSSGMFETSAGFGASTIYAGTINTQLGSTDVTIHTAGGSGGSGNISASNVDIFGGAGNDLSLLAYGGGAATGHIDISNSMISLGSGKLTMVAGWDGTGTNRASSDGTDGSLTITDSMFSAGGVKLAAVADISIVGMTKGTWIQGSGNMDVEAGSLHLTGGSAYGQNPMVMYGGAGVMLQSMGVANTQTVKIDNAIVLQAGSADNAVYGGSFYGGSVAISADGAQDISAQSIQLSGGASGHDNGAEIVGGGDQRITIYGGSLMLAGGGGAGGFNNQARIQHGQWAAGVPSPSNSGNQTLTIYGGATVSLQGGSGDGNLGYYGSECFAALGAAACRGSSSDAMVENLKGAQLLDFSPAAGSLVITGGTVGDQNWAGISNQATGTTQEVRGNPVITLTGGASGGRVEVSGPDIFELSNDAGIYSKGSGMQTISASTLTINGGSGASTVGGAGISNEYGGSGTLFIQTTGNVSLQGGASSAASPHSAAAYLANRDGGLVQLSVGGDLSVVGGSGGASPALIGTIEGAGNVMIAAGGSISVTANASYAAIGSNSTGYGASVTMVANNDIILTDSLTRGVRIGSLFDSLNPTSVALSARNDITIGSASGYGAMIGVSTPTAGTATVDLYAGAGGYGGDLLLNSSARVKVGAGTVSLRAAQDAAANGGITLMTGSAIYGGQIALAAGGDVTLDGDIHSAPAGGIKAAAGVDVYGGTLNASQYGGDAFVSSDLVATAGDINLYARTGAASNTGGEINLYGPGFLAGNAVFIMGQGDVNLAGSVTTDSNSDIYAFAGVGYSGTGCSGGPCPDPMFSSLSGGNLNLAATSLLSSSGSISLAANVGTAASANGNISLLALGQVEANGSISLVAGHNIDLHGSVDSTGFLPPGELTVVAGAGFSRAPSSIGGNLTVSGSLFGNQLVKLVAESGASSGANGGISQTGGSIQTATGGIDVIGAGDVSLGGSVAAYGGNLKVQAGMSDNTLLPTQYGGDLGVSGNLYSNGSKIDLFAQSGTATGLKGSVAQSAGGVIYGGNITLVGAGHATISGAITGTSSVLMDAGWNNASDAETLYGGNLLFTGTSNIQSGGFLKAYAEAGILAATGGNVSQAGTMNAGSNILIYGDRDVAINGSLTAAAAIVLWAGWNSTPYYGGSLTFGPGSQVAANGGDLAAYAVGALESHGDIIQYGGSLFASSDLTLAADGNVKVFGQVEAGMNLNLYAGINAYAADYDEAAFHDPTYTSAYGGNIVLGGGSRLIGDHVGLYANQGSSPDGTSGHVLQAAGGEINVLDGTIVTSLDVYAAGNVALNGVATVDAGDPVTVHAGFDNPNGGLPQSLADRSVAINSLITDGSNVWLYATGPIAANIQDANLINANISGNSGGIEINHTGAGVPTTITLIDTAATNSAIGFGHRGSALVLNAGHSFSTAGGDIFVTAPDNNLSYSGGSFTGASTLLAANGSLTVASAMSVMGDVGLAAGTVLDVNSLVQAGKLTLSAPTVNIVSGNVDVFGGDAIVIGSTINIGSGATRVMGANVFFGGGTLNLDGRVQASGQIEFNLANINGNAGGNFYAAGATSSITGFASGNITLDNASYFSAGDNIDLKLTGAGSTLSLLNGSYLVADTYSLPGSIFLDFPARESGGLVIAGVGSGLFIGDTSTPATESNGLHVKFAPPAGGGSTTVVNELTRATDDVTKPQTEENSPPPPPTTGPAGSTQGPGDLGGTTGADGTFGSDSGGTGSGGSGAGSSGGGTGEQTSTTTQKDEASTTASNTKDDGTKDEKTDPKDEKNKKDKKDKQSDDAKEEKKDDKPAQKKVAQCGT